MATTTLMSVAEFAALPDESKRSELDSGALIPMTPVRAINSRTARRINSSVDDAAIVVGAAAYVEAAFQLQDDPPVVRVPDIAVVSSEQDEASPDQAFFQGAPLLAIEVVSPSETPRDLSRKIQQYLAAGAKSVWAVYAAEREIHRFTPQGAQILTAADSIAEPDVLGQWSSTIANYSRTASSSARQRTPESATKLTPPQPCHTVASYRCGSRDWPLHR